LSELIAQFDVPIREINKVLPEIVLRRSKGDLDKRPPLRSLRLSDQAHVRFTRQPIAFARIAWDARAHHIFPRGHASSIPRHDMIEIQVAPLEKMAAVLAGIVISLKYVVPGEFYFLLRKPIEHQ
jgi:hypothetical protein